MFLLECILPFTNFVNDRMEYVELIDWEVQNWGFQSALFCPKVVMTQVAMSMPKTFDNDFFGIFN